MTPPILEKNIDCPLRLITRYIATKAINGAKKKKAAKKNETFPSVIPEAIPIIASQLGVGEADPIATVCQDSPNLFKISSITNHSGFSLVS